MSNKVHALSTATMDDMDPPADMDTDSEPTPVPDPLDQGISDFSQAH